MKLSFSQYRALLKEWAAAPGIVAGITAAYIDDGGEPKGSGFPDIFDIFNGM